LEDFAGESKHFGFGGDGYAVRCVVTLEIAAVRGLTVICIPMAVRCAAVRRVALMVWEFTEAPGLLCGWYGGAVFGAEALHLDAQGAL